MRRKSDKDRLNYADVLAGTPSVVVQDLRTGKTKTMYGGSDITSDNILKALAEVSGK